MTSIERTAYPRFPKLLTAQDLQRLFSPAPQKPDWVNGFARLANRRLALMVLTQVLSVPALLPPRRPDSTRGSRTNLGLHGASGAARDYVSAGHQSLYRHPKAAPKLIGDAVRMAREVCRVVNTRIDIINILIAELARLDYELRCAAHC
jgi:hypothetical protein